MARKDSLPGSESASSEAKSQEKNPGADGDKPDNSWSEWGNPHQIAVNGSNESPQDRTLGCFISQSFTSPKTNEQQQRPVQTNATAPEPKKTSLPPSQNARTWGFGEPTSNKPDPKKRPAQTKRDKKQKTTATSPTSNLPPHAGDFNKASNCHQFDGSSFPQHVSTEEGAAILLDPIIKNIFGNPNQDAINGQVLVCLDPRAGRYFICINNDHDNKNWGFCKHLVQGNSQPGSKAPPTRYFNAPSLAVGILCAIHYLYSNLPANLLREIESAVGFTGPSFSTDNSNFFNTFGQPDVSKYAQYFANQAKSDYTEPSKLKINVRPVSELETLGSTVQRDRPPTLFSNANPVITAPTRQQSSTQLRNRRLTADANPASQTRSHPPIETNPANTTSNHQQLPTPAPTQSLPSNETPAQVQPPSSTTAQKKCQQSSPSTDRRPKSPRQPIPTIVSSNPIPTFTSNQIPTTNFDQQQQ